MTIQQVSQALSVPAPTLRSWERRYGIAAADRSEGGHRRYSAEQVAVLRQMRDRVAAGQRPAEAAAALHVSSTTAPDALVTVFTQAAEAMEPAAIVAVLHKAEQALGLDRTVDEVLFPAMRHIGRRWELGETGVAEEHLASHTAQTWLVRALHTGPALRDARPLLLCSGPQEQHTLGLDALAALLRRRSWDCRVLGARMPADSLVRAVETVQAAAVILLCHLAPGRADAVATLSSPALRHTRLFYAGGAFSSRQSRHGVPGQYLGTNLGDAADLVTRTLAG